MKTVFLTGANGFVGLNIAQALLNQGYKVVAGVRKTSNTNYLDAMRVDIRVVDFTDRASLKSVIEQCDYIIHTAGNTSCDKKDWSALVEANINTTRLLLELAAETNIQRFVYTSTTSTIGSQRKAGKGADEQVKLQGFRARNPYGQTKMEAEKLVAKANENGLETITLNLAEVLGAYDHNLQWGRMVLAVAADQLPFIPPGGGSFCHAQDAAEAHVAALTAGTPGERYIIAGADHHFADFVKEIQRQLETDVNAPGTNFFLLWLGAKAHELMPVLFRNKPLVEAYRIRVFGGHHYFDSKRAERDLGYKVSSLADMVKDCIQWYTQHEFIRIN